MFYGSVEEGTMRYDANLSYARNNYETTRNVIVGAVNRVAAGDYDANQFGVNARVGREYELDNGVEITPYVGARYTHLDIESYTETGAGSANLSVDDQSYSALNGVVSAEIEKEFTTDNGYSFVPEFRASYAYDFINDDVETNATFSGGGASFETRGIQPDRHTFSVGTGVKIARGEGYELSVNYDADFRDGYNAHNGMVNLRYDF